MKTSPAALIFVVFVALAFALTFFLLAREDQDEAECPVDERVCARARALQDAFLIQKNYRWLADNFPAKTSVLCNDPASGPVQAGVCDGAAPSERRLVYAMGNRLVSSEEYTRLVADWFEGIVAREPDNIGPPQPTLYSIGCQRMSEQPLCHNGYIVVFSKLMEGGPMGSVRGLLYFEFSDGDPPDLVTTFRGPFPRVAEVDSILNGGELQGFFGAQQTTVFIPWPR